jgi:ferredoxin
MSERIERQVGDLTVVIDRTSCAGFRDCITAAPEAFDLDDDGVCAFLDGIDQISREQLLDACLTCPVDAIAVRDRDGHQLAP